MVAGILIPSLSDKIKFVKQAIDNSPPYLICVKIPLPAGIKSPERLNPITVIELEEIINPVSSAKPPEALITVIPFTSN